MIVVKFTKNPAGDLWIGWAEYQNGTYFASGHTMDNLIYRVKQCLYQKKRVPFSQVWLDTKQSSKDDVPVLLMSKMFRTKYWRDSQETVKTATTTPKPVEKPVAAPKETKYDYYEYKVKDGRLVVYGVLRREINSYDLRKNDGGNNDANEQ